MNIQSVLKPVVVVFLLGVTLFTSCKKDDQKSPSELYAEEMALLEKFKETDTYKGWFDEAEMVIDSSDYNGLVYFQLEKGWGDTVLVSKRVGIRYTMYYVLDSVGAEEPYLTKVMSNKGANDPLVYVVGNPDPYNGVYPGMDLGIRYMNCYGTSRILFPSTLGGNDYVTRVVELTITYIGR